MEAVRSVGYETPSPIQAAFIPVAVKGGDVIGQARTGTGKTAAFVLPVLERIDFASARPQAIVLVPTRELCEQVGQECRRLSTDRGCRTVVIVGGRPMREQIDALNRGVHVVIGTPGRVIDLIGRGILRLDGVKVVVLDEADRMLDIGFRPDIEKILRRCPTERQTFLLSATVPPPVERLAQRYMRNPDNIDLSSDGVTVDTIEQYYVTVDEDRKFGALVRILELERPNQVLVFTRTKRGSDKLYQRFAKRLSNVAMMHGDLQQNVRDRTLQKFREGKLRMLIATDVVGRGIDVSTVSHIINYDIPEYHDDYVHRVGRTGRMSSSEKGVAITLVTKEQGELLTAIEMRINKMLPEYDLSGYEAFRAGPARKHVEPERRVTHEIDFPEFSDLSVA
ncbi:MAG: DEAD/DEAH box helicase [Planctomycetales bacterium]